MSNLTTRLEGSPALSYDSHDESASETAEYIKDGENRNHIAGQSKQFNTLNSTSFETDLSAPRPNRHEDRSDVYASDPKYQKYVQLVGRNLQSFDYVQEWADVTAFLTKLSRSFEIYSKFAVVPHKVTVTKRLAQCLNPALPTGVHQKTLSIYELIAKQIGSDELVTDLPLYALGLFPFMRNASLKAKPQLLGILEDFFVPLGPGLRPCLKSITVGVLPGLEEGSADVINRVVGLLDKLRDTIDEPFFFQTLFLIMITNSEQRESALKYLAQRLPVFTRQEDVAQVCGDDASLMARALAATMTDPKTLVLRAALDLVMTRFPLRTTIFRPKDLVLLMKHASEVVLKKDMSLNRRLYTWLLGPGDSEAEQAAYFRQFAQLHLTDALLGSFAAMSSAPDHQHTVLRVLIGLTDKPAISQPVLDTIFVPLMLLLIAERDSRVERALPVRLASVSRMFIEMLDPFFTWSNIVNQLTDAVAGFPEEADIQRITRALQLVQFFVQTFELDDEATLQVHVPMALLSILASLEWLLRQSQSTMSSLSCCFARIAIELFTRIPKSLFLATDAESPDASIVDTLRVDLLFDITRSFYRIHRQEDDVSTPLETTESSKEHLTRVKEVDRSAAQIVRGTGLLYAIIRLCKDIAAQLGLKIVASASDSTTAADQIGTERLAAIAMEDVCHILRTATTYSHDLLHTPELAHCPLPLPKLVTDDKSLEAFQHSELWVPVFIEIVCNSHEFSVVNVALSTLLGFVGRGSLAKSVLANDDTLPKIVERLWDTLSPKHVSDHYQATQLLYLLRGQLDSRSVERHLAAKLASSDYSLAGQRNYTRELAHFAVLWHNLRLIQREGNWSTGINHDPLAFSRLLLLVIDNAALSDVASLAGGDYAAGLSRHAAARAWVDASTDEWEHIVETLVLLLLQDIHTRKQTLSIVLAAGITSQRQEYTCGFDYGLAIYYIDTIQRYLACAGGGVVKSMLTKPPSSPAVRQVCESLAVSGRSWLQVLVAVAAEFALTDAAPNEDTIQAIEATRARAAELASYLLMQPQVLWPPQFIASLQGRLVDSLLYCVLYRRTLVQPLLLDFFASLCRTSVCGEDSMITVASKDGQRPALAGIAAIPDLTLLSRLVLAALTMQMSMVALSKWVKVLAIIVPYVQDHVNAPGDQELMRLLVLPCVHALRMLLSQCAEYFGRANELSVTSHSSIGKQLYKRLLPLFVVPATAFSAETREAQQDAMSVGVLTTLLDAFDMFLSLSLRNVDKIPTESTVQRPSSRASESSVQSSVSFGALGSIPVMKFVTSIFGPDTMETTVVDTESVPERQHQTEATDNTVGFDVVDFNLVSTLGVMREVWNAFDFGQSKKSVDSPFSADQLLLREFGIVDSRANESGGTHIQRSVHLHISRILEHATLAQPTEISEAMVVLWTCDNPQWITSLDTSVRRSTGRGSRRRHSSVSSLHTSRTSISTSTHRDVPAAPTMDDDVSTEWSWRATDLLETVPGRTPMNVLIGLLNALHVRSIDTAASTSSNSSAVGTDGTRAPTRFSSLDDIALTRFIELYTRHRLTARSAAPLVPHMLSMLKEYNNNAQQNKFMLPFLLRMFTELCERVSSQTQSIDPLQQVYSHDLCTAYARMVDNCILIAGRSFDQTTWLRRANTEAPGMMRAIHTDGVPGESTYTLTEDDIIEHILTYIGGVVIPQFTQLVPDYERQVSIAMNLMHYAVVPAFKSHMTGGYSGPAQALTSRSQHFAQILRCLNALSQQASLMKVWKRDVWEFFCDAKFFPGSLAISDHATMSPALAPHWRHLIRTLLVSEKERFAEVLAKVSSASSGPALFANREHEAEMRAISLRRLSFVVWAGAVNQYLASLPQIQEKLVDILKNSPHPAVQIEVFLCLRVLLCRVSNHHMSNFWPMLLTELMRLFHQQLNREGREEPEQANLFLAACKFLDLLFILGTDDFLVHQWIFITDTIDALHGSRSSSSALLDQLSSRLLSMPTATRRNKPLDSETYPATLLSDSDDPTNLVYHQMSAKGMATAGALGLDGADLQTLSGRPLKRPIIRQRSVASIRELDAFVHNASVQAYQAAFTLAEPDTEFIEALLVSDLIFFDFGGISSSTGSVDPVAGYIGEYDY
ncbi:hypothetical protein FBU31_000134 [Coemansia sp. 'formosensis']|nr:hypothetical protein FBU31_000134 [Coemansia sp. 'formosensis']